MSSLQRFLADDPSAPVCGHGIVLGDQHLGLPYLRAQELVQRQLRPSHQFLLAPPVRRGHARHQRLRAPGELGVGGLGRNVFLETFGPPGRACSEFTDLGEQIP